MQTCVISLTNEGSLLAEKIAATLNSCSVVSSNKKIAEIITEVWDGYDGIICIMATGIVVRTIAPLLKDKTTDPCVVVLDQNGEYVISLVSGHLGGGNELAREVAHITGGAAVITTASDNLRKTAIDLWARRNGLVVNNKSMLTRLSARQVNGLQPGIYSTLPLVKIPADFLLCASKECADIVITYDNEMITGALCCIPEMLYLGVGCNRGTSMEDIEISFKELCHKHHISPRAFKGLASIDVKQDEEGIRNFAVKFNLKESFFTRDELNSVENVSFSEAVMKAVGAKGVAEPAALLAAGFENAQTRLIISKMKWRDVTLAVAERIKCIWE